MTDDKAVILVNVAAEFTVKLKQRGIDMETMGEDEARRVLDEYMPAFLHALNAGVIIALKRWPTMKDVEREVCPGCTFKAGCMTRHLMNTDVYQCCEGMRAAAAKDR